LKEFLEAPFWIGVRSLSWQHLFNQGHGRLPALLLNVSISGTAALTV
jgi:hypothetical protein